MGRLTFKPIYLLPVWITGYMTLMFSQVYATTCITPLSYTPTRCSITKVAVERLDTDIDFICSLSRSTDSPVWMIQRDDRTKGYTQFNIIISQLFPETYPLYSVSFGSLVLPLAENYWNQSLFQCFDVHSLTPMLGECDMLSVLPNFSESTSAPLEERPFIYPVDFFRSGVVNTGITNDNSIKSIFVIRSHKASCPDAVITYQAYSLHDIKAGSLSHPLTCSENPHIEGVAIPIENQDKSQADLAQKAYWTLNVTENSDCALRSSPTNSRRIYIHIDSHLKHQNLPIPDEGEQICFQRRNDTCGTEFVLADAEHPSGKLACSLNLDINECPDIEAYNPNANRTHLCLSNNQGHLDNSTLYIFLPEDHCYEHPDCFLITITEAYRMGSIPELPASTTEPLMATICTAEGATSTSIETTNAISTSMEMTNATTFKLTKLSSGTIAGISIGAIATTCVVTAMVVITAGCFIKHYRKHLNTDSGLITREDL